jgi:NAD(P)-dependent dehydrogenase (short-subunit alcohol dehydrogenase family)
MSKPIALILGSGANLGHHVAGRFRTEGYRVATVSRSKSTANDDETSLSLTCDLADPREVETVFATVRKAWGEPSVVVYNGMVSPPLPNSIKAKTPISLSLFPLRPLTLLDTAYSLTNALTPESAFDLSTQDFERHLAVNTTSAFVAVREALSGFKHMGRGNFFYTGNYLPWHSHPKLMTLGVGKAASAHFVQIADEVWSGRGMR